MEAVAIAIIEGKAEGNEVAGRERKKFSPTLPLSKVVTIPVEIAA